MGRISSKGQITVPLDVRERLGLVPGTEIEFLVRDAEVVLRKGGSAADPVDRVYGILELGRPVDRILEELRGPAPPPRRPRARRRRPARRR
jgi:AbrB family looped-hinge helix DNA binding protein